MACRCLMVVVVASGIYYGESREIIQSSSGPRHLFTISLKDSHLLKIAESVISFCLKKKF